MEKTLKELGSTDAPERQEGKFEVVYWGCWRATFATYAEAKEFYDQQDEPAALWDLTEGAVACHYKSFD